MSFDENSSSSPSSDEDDSTRGVDIGASASEDEDDFASRVREMMKRQLLLEKVSELEFRAQRRHWDSILQMERFGNIQKSLEVEMEKVQNSMFSVEQLEGLKTIFEDFQANVQHNVSRLRKIFEQMREFAAKQCENTIAQDKPLKENLRHSLVKSIQSLKCCPTVPEMKMNSKAVSVHSSKLIGVLDKITKSNTCSPATTCALKIATGTIENLNRAFQDRCKEVEDLKVLSQKQREVAAEVDEDYMSSRPQYGPTVQEQVPKGSSTPERPKTDAVGKSFTLPQDEETIQEAKIKAKPLERPVTALKKTPKDLQSPPKVPPAPARSFALSNTTQSEQKTKVIKESKEETRKVTSFNKIAQEEPQSLAPLGIHHPSPVKSLDLNPISQFGKETQELAQKDHQCPFNLNINRSSHVKSLNLSQILQPVEETKDVKPFLVTGTSFEELAQKDHQGLAIINIHRSSLAESINLPHIPPSIETKHVESILVTGTSFEELAQQDQGTLNIHHSSTAESFNLSVEETKDVESMFIQGTSFEELAQKDQGPSTLNIHRSSPAEPFNLSQNPQSEEQKKDVESMLVTGTSFEELAQKDHQCPSTLTSHSSSPVTSFNLPHIPQSIGDTKLLIKGTSFEELAQKDLQSQSTLKMHRSSHVKSLDETKSDVVPVKDLQNLSPVHTHPSSIMKLPQIQTNVKSSLQNPDKSDTEEQYINAAEEHDDRLLHKRMKGQTFVIDIEAQENNLTYLDRSFQNNSISSEMYNMCRGYISQMLQSVDLRLGCLFRRYIRHVQLKQLRKTLDKNFKLTRNLNDGLAFKKVHSQLCKFDHFQQSVSKIWDAKQASTDETRRWCIIRTARLYQQMNSIHGLHLTGISCVQRHVPLHLLTVTPLRFNTQLHLSPPQRQQTAPCRVSSARLPRNNWAALHSTDVARNISGSFLNISHVRYSWPV